MWRWFVCLKVDGSVLVIYNMGFMDHPVGELFEKVNDGQYHVVRFYRDGPNATIQVDQLPVQAKFPTGVCALYTTGIHLVTTQVEIYNTQIEQYSLRQTDREMCIV